MQVVSAATVSIQMILEKGATAHNSGYVDLEVQSSSSTVSLYHNPTIVQATPIAEGSITFPNVSLPSDGTYKATIKIYLDADVDAANSFTILSTVRFKKITAATIVTLRN